MPVHSQTAAASVPGSSPTAAVPAPLDVRPLRSTDRDALAAMFAALSPQSRAQRFLGPKPHVSARELDYFTAIDHRRHAAVGAFDPAGRLVGEARYACPSGEDRVADLALLVADDWHGHGVGSMLARAAIALATANGIRRLSATTLVDNVAARRLLRRLGCTTVGFDADVLELTLELRAR